MMIELKKRLNIIKKSKKIKVFYFGNTVKKESNNFYITEIKENKKFVAFEYVFLIYKLYYSIPLISVEAERIFSHCNLVVTYLRNRL